MISLLFILDQEEEEEEEEEIILPFHLSARQVKIL